VGWFVSPDLRDDKAHHEGLRILGDLLTGGQCFVEFHFREQPCIENASTQGGRELNREPHIGMPVVQGNHRRSDANLLQSRLSQHAIGALSGIEVPAPLLEGSQDRAFEAIPGLMLGKKFPAVGIWLLDGDDSTRFGERHHLA
jgi:hypothetical protein